MLTRQQLQLPVNPVHTVKIIRPRSCPFLCPAALLSTSRRPGIGFKIEIQLTELTMLTAP